MTRRTHLLGASGSGTTTLGRALAARLDVPHLDTDAYYWLPTDPPFGQERPVAERIAMLSADLDRSDGWALSGSLVGWGDVFISCFDLVIFLWVPPAVRLTRLRERERERYGDRIEPGGTHHEMYCGFMAWAERYDDDSFDGRSRRLHERWLEQMTCPVVRLEGEESIDGRLARLAPHLDGTGRR